MQQSIASVHLEMDTSKVLRLLIERGSAIRSFDANEFAILTEKIVETQKEDSKPLRVYITFETLS